LKRRTSTAYGSSTTSKRSSEQTNQPQKEHNNKNRSFAIGSRLSGRSNDGSGSILLTKSKLHSPRILASVRFNRQITRRIVGAFARRLLVARNGRSHGPRRPEKERRLCGLGILRVAPEKDFFNRIDPLRTVGVRKGDVRSETRARNVCH